VAIVLLISGCATAPKKETPPVKTPAPAVVEKPKGIYHKVSKQESLWRIAKTYNVGLDEIIKANNIPNAAVIEENQLILIPGATEAEKVTVESRPPDGKSDEFAWPLRGRIISYFNDVKGHNVNRGIDIMATEGEDVKAVRDGKVVMADYLNGYGYTVIIDHFDGFYSVYAHASDLLVKLNDLVTRGTTIGHLGKSGRTAFLHFEVRKFEQANNPLYYLP